jgi:DNA invertase Pin-like site-specific DNA recombinase
MDENPTLSQSAIAKALAQIASLNKRPELYNNHLTSVNSMLNYGRDTGDTPMKLVTYTRVSTQRQGQSGLGLEAQQAAIEAYAKAAGAEVAGAYTEVESGKRADRPELAKAVAHAKRIKGRLVIAKLDRLARNVAFVSAIMESGVDFVACDNPHANRLTLHILAAVAEDEARRISERTTAALAAAKARGVKLGSARPGHWRGREEARMRGMELAREAAKDRFAREGAPVYAKALPIAREMHEAGESLQAIADKLNAEGISTPRGAEWKPMQVARLLMRACCEHAGGGRRTGRDAHVTTRRKDGEAWQALK